jgi:hypothetical protein
VLFSFTSSKRMVDGVIAAAAAAAAGSSRMN